VLAVVFGEHKESAFATAGVDRLLVLEARFGLPEQAVCLRAVDNQFNPRHWLLPDSRSGGGELGRPGRQPGRTPGDAWQSRGRPVHRPRRCRPARPGAAVPR
jgi:hypothetical protein